MCADPNTQDAVMAIEAEDLEKTIGELSNLGGKILSQQTFAAMKVANVEDSDGRKMCIWQSL